MQSWGHTFDKPHISTLFGCTSTYYCQSLRNPRVGIVYFLDVCNILYILVLISLCTTIVCIERYDYVMYIYNLYTVVCSDSTVVYETQWTLERWVGHSEHAANNTLIFCDECFRAQWWYICTITEKLKLYSTGWWFGTCFLFSIFWE